MQRPGDSAAGWAVAAVVALCSAQALAGGWVYDDNMLARHPACDGVDDLLAVFDRDSFDYLADSISTTSGVTYRPFSVASLIAVNVLGGRQPWPHHLTSLALHLASFAVLCLLCRKRAPQLPGWWACAPAAVFALHPALTEAYQWISGRHDLLAGLALSVFAWALATLELARGPAPRRAVITALIAPLVGALCKETFVPAAAWLVAAHALPAARNATRPASRQPLWVGGAALGLALLLSGLLRARAGAGSPATRGVLDILAEPSFYARLPALLGLGVHTLAWPSARPMRNLSWELSHAANLASLAWLTAAVAGWLWLCARGRWRAALLVAGAGATLAPTASVADVFWLGFDRYLYLPGVLLVVAACELPRPEAAATPDARQARVARWVAFALAAWLACGCALSAEFYVDDRSLAAAMLRLRPDDPTGFILAAGLSSGGPVEPAMAAYMRGIREQALPVALVREALRVQHLMRLYDAVPPTLEDAVRRFPDSLALALDLLELRGVQGRFGEALPIATKLLQDRYYCPPARRVLERWQGWSVLPSAARAQSGALLTSYPCR
jgi:hypothetical protein